jgi:hypothetical protein
MPAVVAAAKAASMPSVGAPLSVMPVPRPPAERSFAMAVART